MRTRTANSDAESSHSDPSKSGGNNKFDSRKLEQSDYMKLINNAKEYQRLWGPWKEFGNETYSYWTQQVEEVIYRVYEW